MTRREGQGLQNHSLFSNLAWKDWDIFNPHFIHSTIYIPWRLIILFSGCVSVKAAPICFWVFMKCSVQFSAHRSSLSLTWKLMNSHPIYLFLSHWFSLAWPCEFLYLVCSKVPYTLIETELWHTIVDFWEGPDTKRIKNWEINQHDRTWIAPLVPH